MHLKKSFSIQDSLLEPTRLLKHVFAVLKLENISNKRVAHLYFCKISVQDGLIKAYPYIRKWRVVTSKILACILGISYFATYEYFLKGILSYISLIWNYFGGLKILGFSGFLVFDLWFWDIFQLIVLLYMKVNYQLGFWLD